MTAAPPVAVRSEGGVSWITLDRPGTGNPVDAESVAALTDAVRSATGSGDGVIVLRSTGRAFSVGGDLAAFASAPDPGRYVDDLAEALHRVVSELTRCDAVVVAAVQGVVAGAGLPLAAAADVVLAAASARFTLAYTKVGLTPDGGSSLLTATLGLHRALHLALLNPVLTAAEAQSAGLVAEVHPDDELDAAVQRVAERLAAGSRTAQAAAKRLMRDVATPTPEAALRLETLAIRAAADGPDGREGVRAFLDKRLPAFPSAQG